MALKKKYVGRLLAESHSTTSRFTKVRIASALARRARKGPLTIQERDRALIPLKQDMATFYIVEMNSEMTVEAVELLT